MLAYQRVIYLGPLTNIDHGGVRPGDGVKHQLPYLLLTIIKHYQPWLSILYHAICPQTRQPTTNLCRGKIEKPGCERNDKCWSTRRGCGVVAKLSSSNNKGTCCVHMRIHIYIYICTKYIHIDNTYIYIYIVYLKTSIHCVCNKYIE